MVDRGKKVWRVVAPLLLVAVTVVAYLPALGAGFIWDDDSHVTDNETLRSGDGLLRIWTELGATPQYYPLVHTTFWVEHHLYGTRPFGYHLVNVLLHALNALLIVALLRSLGVPGAWLVGFLFALHPVHVESVAWVSERKNVLSGAFYLAAALAYLRFAPPGEPARVRGPRRYYLTFLGLFVAALLSKSVTATLPAALLLVIYWKRGCLEWRDFSPLVVPFTLAGAAGMVTVWMENHYVGAAGESWDLGIVERILLAGRAFWFYLGKLAMPSGLVFIYPRWSIDVSSLWQYLFPVAALAVVLALFGARKKIGRGPLVAVLLFAGTLVPALGFFNVYPFRFSFVADHFQYLASLGPLVLAGAALASLTTRWSKAGAAVVVVLLLLLGTGSFKRTFFYADAETLWRDTLARNPGAWMANINLGVEYDRRGQAEQAYRQYRMAIEKKPDLAGGWNNLGMAAVRLGRRTEGIDHLVRALRLKPDHVNATMNLANALYAERRIGEAAVGYRRVIELAPGHSAARNNLGGLLLTQGDLSGAAAQFEAAVAARPGFVRAWANLGETYERLGWGAEAAAAFRAALAVEPEDQRAAAGLARVEGKK